MYNHHRRNSKRKEGTTIEPGVAEDAAVLTGIGLATAFGLLVLLMAAIFLIRLIAGRFSPGTDRRDTEEASAAGGEAHDKALAAAIAVTALWVGSSHDDNLRDDAG